MLREVKHNYLLPYAETSFYYMCKHSFVFEVVDHETRNNHERKARRLKERETEGPGKHVI